MNPRFALPALGAIPALAWLALAPLAAAQPRALPPDALGTPGARLEERAEGAVLLEAVPARPVRPVLRAASFSADRLAGLASFAGRVEGGAAVLDPAARLLLAEHQGMGKRGDARALVAAAEGLAAGPDASGEWSADVLVVLAPGASTAALEAAGATVRVRAGDVVAVRVPVARLDVLGAARGVRRVEAARLRRATTKAGRADIRADLVHAGVGLPRAFQGENVVVGVIDSGLDITHPDFFDAGGSRVRYLLEFTQDGGQREWTKAQIDANPAAVTERDGNGGGGHGTHVTGTAAGGGRADANFRGIAPKSSIIFVKGIREPDSNGGFSDADVIAGVDYIFRRADEMGRPAVINLSIGSNGGPLDGSSAYEKALSNLVRPGHLIVAANGNEGFDLIHAGGASVPGRPSLSMFYPDGNADRALLDLWYTPGSVGEVGVGVFRVVEGALRLAAFSGWMPAGQKMNDLQPLSADGTTFGSFYLDAATTQAPGNGDGQVFALVSAAGAAGVEPWRYVWGIFTRGTAAGRTDVWASGAELVHTAAGFTDLTEMPGNTDMTVGTPASAKGLIAVGSYVTANEWTNLDGNRYEARIPSPDRSGSSVFPVLGALSHFSSLGPTRDGRTKPEIGAPGQRIFAPLSSHLTEGVGVDRSDILAGRRYQGMHGTSMASPHVAGVVALMLEANPNLSRAEALEILQSTARTDAQTGAGPNNRFGAGRVDALAAVKEVLRRVGGGGGATRAATLARFDPAGEQRVFSLDRRLPVDSGFVAGMNVYGDRAKSVAFTLPDAAPSGEVTAVDVWFGYKRPGEGARRYAVEIYAGTPATGPTGAALARKEFAFTNALADADFATREGPSAHAFDAPVPVGGSFFVSVSFGSYPPSAAGALGLASSPLAGANLPHVWEQWSDGTWHTVSSSWNLGAGTGADGTEPWVQAAVRYGVSTAAEDAAGVPPDVALEPARPNPFRGAATLAYAVPSAGPVRLRVYDALGREVARLVDAVQPAGRYHAALDGSRLAAGLYFGRLEAAGRTVTTRLVRVP